MVWDFVELNFFSVSNGNWIDVVIEWVFKLFGVIFFVVLGYLN